MDSSFARNLPGGPGLGTLLWFGFFGMAVAAVGVIVALGFAVHFIASHVQII